MPENRARLSYFECGLRLTRLNQLPCLLRKGADSNQQLREENMFNWKNASRGDLKRLEVIEEMLKDHPKLLEFLFKTDKAELNAGPDTLIKRMGYLSHGERILVRVSLDIWSGSGDTKLLDLFSLDQVAYKNVLLAICKCR